MDGKKYNGRLIRMNEADGGFKRPSTEGRKKFHMHENRYHNCLSFLLTSVDNI